MSTHRGVSMMPPTDSGGPARRMRLLPSRKVLALTAEIGVILTIAIALGLLISSCGSERSSGTVAQRTATPPVQQAVVASHEPVSQPVAQDASREAPVSGATEPVPPDVAVTTIGTVEPGAWVEIVANTTPDVVQVTLWDGIHDKQSLDYDADAKAWRGRYRVPLHMTSERLGLSVTATNDLRHWRRVWVFLSLSNESTPAESDSTDGC